MSLTVNADIVLPVMFSYIISVCFILVSNELQSFGERGHTIMLKGTEKVVQKILAIVVQL